MRPFPILLLLLLAASSPAQDFPQAAISNGLIDAKFYLPDPGKGYYRGTRFDWSGNTFSLRYQGHEYFGKWFEKYDPKIHDAIMGPVEDFRSQDGSLGYAEAKPGGNFVRIGVGTLRKPSAAAFQPFFTYEIIDPGTWTNKVSRDKIQFTHTLKDPSGYAYVYRKTVRLLKGKPEMVIEHSLKNTGKRPIDTQQYNHNFFVIDGRPTGPEFVVKFAFDARSARDLKGLATVASRELRYARELQKGESVFTEIQGFPADPSGYDFRIENVQAGAGVRFTGDRPIERLVYWSIRTTLCPEPYIRIQAAPGREAKWTIRYQFYTLPSKTGTASVSPPREFGWLSRSFAAVR